MCCRGLCLALCEDSRGEGELDDLVAQVPDLLALLGVGLAEPGFLVGGLAGLGADALVELVLQVGVALKQGHAVDPGLGGERDDGEGAVGGGGLAGEEAVGRGVRSADNAWL